MVATTGRHHKSNTVMECFRILHLIMSFVRWLCPVHQILSSLLTMFFFRFYICKFCLTLYLVHLDGVVYIQECNRLGMTYPHVIPITITINVSNSLVLWTEVVEQGLNEHLVYCGTESVYQSRTTKRSKHIFFAVASILEEGICALKQDIQCIFVWEFMI